MSKSEEKDERAEGDALLDLLARGTELTRQLVDETARLRQRLAEGASSQLFGLLASHAATALLCSSWVPASMSTPGSNPGGIDRVTN